MLVSFLKRSLPMTSLTQRAPEAVGTCSPSLPTRPTRCLILKILMRCNSFAQSTFCTSLPWNAIRHLAVLASQSNREPMMSACPESDGPLCAFFV